MERSPRARRALVALLALASCAAAPNPDPPRAPAPWSATDVVEKTAESAPATEPAPAAQEPPAKPEAASKPAPPAAGAAGAAAADEPGQDGGPPLPIATVAGATIDVRELLAQWVHLDSRAALDQLDRLVLGRIVEVEAARLGLVLTPDEEEGAYRSGVATIEANIQKRRPGLSLDRWVDEVLGLDPAQYRRRLRADAMRRVLAERVSRAFLLQSEHADVRLIVTEEEAGAREARAAVQAGEAFADVARRLSKDPSGKDGGRVPSVVRDDTPIARLAFETPVGQVSDAYYSQGNWLLVYVEARPEPLPGRWPDIAEAVNRSLAERGMEDLEFEQWRAAMLRRYQVDIRGFLELVGGYAR